MKKKVKWITHEELMEKLMKRPGFRQEYDKQRTEFEIAQQMLDARLKKKMSQEELAVKAGTGQAVISRIEGTAKMPTIPLLQRIARALDTKFTITIQ